MFSRAYQIISLFTKIVPLHDPSRFYFHRCALSLCGGSGTPQSRSACSSWGRGRGSFCPPRRPTSCSSLVPFLQCTHHVPQTGPIYQNPYLHFSNFLLQAVEFLIGRLQLGKAQLVEEEELPEFLVVVFSGIKTFAGLFEIFKMFAAAQRLFLLNNGKLRMDFCLILGDPIVEKSLLACDRVKRTPVHRNGSNYYNRMEDVRPHADPFALPPPSAPNQLSLCLLHHSSAF